MVKNKAIAITMARDVCDYRQSHYKAPIPNVINAL